MTKSKMKLLRSTLVMVATCWVSLASAETVTVASDTPLKSSSALLSAKTIKTLSAGTAVKVLETKGTMSRVESVEDPSVKGWILSGSITRNKDVAAAIGATKSAPKAGGNTKSTIAASMGGAAKGFSGESVQAASAATPSSKGFAGSVGAVAKGKMQAATDDLTDEADDVQADAEAAVGKFKGKSAATLEKIESTKVTETDIANFMKEGGLRSRLIR